MKTIELHIHALKNYIKGSTDFTEEERNNILYFLSRMEETASRQESDLSDRLLNKNKYIDAIMGTYFEGRTGNLKIKEIREQLERAYDTGSLQGVGQERSRTYNVAVIVRDGVISELWSDRPNINIHKFDVDDQADDPVLYNQETAEYASIFDVNEILNALESKFK